jgi:kynureninase
MALENHRRGALTKVLKRFAAKFAATTTYKIFDGGAGQ